YDAARTKRKRAERTPLRPPRKSPKRVPSEADAAVVEAARLGLLELLLRAPLRALAERPGQRRADGALPGLADAELVVDLVLGLELEAGDGERVVGAEAERELVAHQLLLETHRGEAEAGGAAVLEGARAPEEAEELERGRGGQGRLEAGPRRPRGHAEFDGRVHLAAVGLGAEEAAGDEAADLRARNAGS